MSLRPTISPASTSTEEPVLPPKEPVPAQNPSNQSNETNQNNQAKETNQTNNETNNNQSSSQNKTILKIASLLKGVNAWFLALMIEWQRNSLQYRLVRICMRAKRSFTTLWDAFGSSKVQKEALAMSKIRIRVLDLKSLVWMLRNLTTLFYLFKIQ